MVGLGIISPFFAFRVFFLSWLPFFWNRFGVRECGVQLVNFFLLRYCCLNYMFIRLNKATAVSTSSLGLISPGFTASEPITRTAQSASRNFHYCHSPFLQTRGTEAPLQISG